MLPELDRQTEFIRKDYPAIRSSFEKFLRGGTVTRGGVLAKDLFQWCREVTMLGKGGHIFILKVETSELCSDLKSADLVIEIRTVDGAKVRRVLPSSETLMKDGAGNYIEDVKDLKGLAKRADHLPPYRVKQL